MIGSPTKFERQLARVGWAGVMRWVASVALGALLLGIACAHERFEWVFAVVFVAWVTLPRLLRPRRRTDAPRRVDAAHRLRMAGRLRVVPARRSR